MEAHLELLNELASRGIKLFVEGDNLQCYAQKGSLSPEIKESIARHKPEIVKLLRGYKENFKLPLAPSEVGNQSPGIQEAIKTQGKSGFHPPAAPVDLGAEAVLDPGIACPAPDDGSVEFAAPRSVFLTGASGFLGAYLLHDLMMATEARVHCLVRCTSESDGDRRIKSNLLKYGLWREDFASRIVVVPGDLAQPLLGLGSDMFDALGRAIDTVYHNGALVNFIYPYASLKDSNVRGTEEVIRLACRAKRKALHFVSTIGVFPPAADRNTTILESNAAVNWYGLTDGYQQSKWVAEKIVTIAAGRGLPVRIYRPGFVTGDSVTGVSNTDDFVSRMIKGCIQLGCVPDSDAMIEMVPVDYVSKAIVHLSLQPELPSNVFHVVNPCRVPSRDLGRILGSVGYKAKLVPYADWRNVLFEDAKTSAGNALFPLLTMFTEDPLLERMPVFDCRNTLESLRNAPVACPKIDAKLIATYLKYFSSIGFLNTSLQRNQNDGQEN